MSMNTALSGLTAAQTDIAATSHNIANVSTIGFRGSRAEFADIYNSSPFSVSRTATGSGTQVTRVAQDYSQGSIVGTGNVLDLAIEGPGFFALRQPNSAAGATSPMLYSRAGAFSMSADGTIVNGSGQQLQGWPVSARGEALNHALSASTPLRVPLAMGTPAETRAISLNVALPSDPSMAGAQSEVPPTAGFDPADNTTWAHRTTLPMLDENGNAVDAEVYFVRVGNPDVDTPETRYELHLFRQGDELVADPVATLSFGADGLPVEGTAPLVFGDTDAITVDLSESALGDDAFSVQSVAQDGVQTSPLSALDVDSSGAVWATYGGGQREAVGKLLLVNFANPQGLRVMGGAAYAETAESGEAAAGAPNGSGFGALRSGALEKANVDLTEELVNLISAQRNYQASAKALETSSSMMQTIMNLRS